MDNFFDQTKGPQWPSTRFLQLERRPATPTKRARERSLQDGSNAVRFPRMLRWREDKPVGEADTLQTLTALLPS